ncbi:hypothetical protein like AT3G24255 [Hibiscus trionum]|uniref:RNase H type-1 domain-containing protein n=1 Tax=Hibiscus trionum TaxID=183268 RepID=A0A9W7MHJ5_HIBTR|nr:hypothetical protein like AT3G24255 [Hibiscus trionum]
MMAFFGLVWSIWLSRNEAIFNNKSFTVVNLYDIAITRIGIWCKSKWPDQCFSILDFIRNPNLCHIVSTKPSRISADSWIAPDCDSVKFNVDASVNGSYGNGGIGGVLRNHLGLQMVRFVKFIGRTNPTEAELLAILEACCIYEHHFAGWNKAVLVESDCEMVCKWINQDVIVPNCFAELTQKCRNFLRKPKWTLVFAYREANTIAHHLAREGAMGKGDFICFN